MRRALVFLFVFCSSALAATDIDNYRDRIGDAKSGIERLLAVTYVDRAEVARIKAAVPAAETIEQNGDRIETSNGWLAAELDRYVGEATAAERTAILTGINERLVAIENSIDEIEAAKAPTTKDADKQKLAEILSRPEFRKPEPPKESLFQKWWRQIQEWLDRNFPRTSTSPGTSPAMGSLRVLLQVLVFAAVIGLLGFLIYKFVPVFGGQRQKKKRESDRVILGERIGTDASASDLFAEAERLARDGELRAAIRKGYVALLVELADRKVIGLARHKTNRDYLRDVRKRHDIFDPMSGLTLTFEKNWYGLRPATDADWNDFREQYRETLRKV